MFAVEQREGKLVSDSSDDTSTVRLGAVPRIENQPPRSVVTRKTIQRWNIGRDVLAAVLLLAALALPWNLYFGADIPGSRAGLFTILLVATVLSLTSVAGSWRLDPLARRLRAPLNIPYLLVVLGVVMFDVVQTVRYGGSANVPGGVGPGAWLGIAGSLLSAQPLITATPADKDRFRRWLLSARIVGYASIIGAALAVGFNLFWRIKAALPTGSSGFGKQNVAIIATAVVYGIVAFVAVVVASRWILQRSRVSRLAAIGLGVSTLVAGIIVWGLPIGREIDAFHGIAQNTSTAGVGFEGYLAWVAAAAVFAPLTLLRIATTEHIPENLWRPAARKGLLLIIVWCAGSVLMRITDIVVSVSLNLSYSPYDSAAMAAFDLVTVVLAVWLYLNLANLSLPRPVISSLCGVLFVLSVSRIVIGVALAPRYASSPSWLNNPVYGNNLAQQITSTFDVVLCGLTLCILAIVVVTGRLAQHRPPEPEATRPDAGRPRIFRGDNAPTQRLSGPPKIYRPGQR
ncbi:hypothetical protein MBRA_08200 [Mycobacterium branderi]|uniref:DUF7937 domain-containing protein n=1 Tax=Mycobacterium branderi TaxID=43348 RepID=A0ABN6AYU6_9MYCO|nr:hypothetical protein MBRA_08200 [Mycobacterium branderi]